MEEWLFFITVPFACLFIYRVVQFYQGRFHFRNLARYFLLSLAVVLLLRSLFNMDQLYTVSVSLALSIFIFFHLFILRSRYLGTFLISYLVCLIPFFIVNGILTSLPVVIYNNEEIIGTKLFTIPLEDFLYGMLLIFINITLHEYFKNKRTSSSIVA